MIKSAAQKRDGRRSSSTMKLEEFAQGQEVTERASKPANLRADVASLEADNVETSPVEKQMVSSTPAKPRMPFSSSFLQPEQFIAELKVTSGADIRPELAFLASLRRSEGTQVVAKYESGGGLLEPDLESFYEPANSVPALELCYEGKPAPVPAHLRTRPLKPIQSVTTDTVDKNSEAGDSHGESSPVLQKSGSGGHSFKSASPVVPKMRVRSFRENLRTREVGRANGGEGNQSGGLRRMLHWGASMEFLRSLERKLGRKKGANGKRDEDRLQQIEAVSQEEAASHPDPDVVDKEEGSSPRSSASSASTTYSEVSSKSQSYKHSGHKKNLKSEAVKSKLWLLRVQQNQGSKESEDDGIYEALRQGATFHTVDTSGEEANDTLGALNGAESKNAISKLVAKHKRNSTWDAGNQLTSDHIFSPKQPRLPTRDAHVLLAPPKRLTGDTTRGETEFRSRKPSRLIEQTVPLQVEHTLPLRETMPIEKTVPLPMPVENRVPLPVPVRIGSQSSQRSPQLCATSPQVSKSPGNAAASPSGGGMQSSNQQPLHTSPRLYGATETGRDGDGIQSSPVDAAAGTGSRKGLNSVEQFSLEESRPNSSLQAQATSSVAQQEVPRSQSRSHSVTGLKAQEAARSSERDMAVVPGGGNAGRPRLREPRQGGLSFEQIVAGRGRSPPTDNTLMKFFFKCREIEGLNKFLALQKRRFLDSSFADSEKCFHMIMSEAGAGLSSMIATICTAWLLENTMASTTSRVWHPIPVMNMCHEDMWNYRDAAWLFHVCGIDANAVLFRDEITPTNEAVISGRVKRVVIGQDILITKADEVASSCTIVSEKFRQEAPKLLQARYMMTLLLAGILVDTNNLSSGSSRDKQQATILLVGAGSLGRNGFYNHLMNIRDEDYVTTFIKEIYGESNALTGEKPAQLAAGIERSETKGVILPKDERSERPISLATSKVSSEVSAPILPSQKPATISETESKNYDDRRESLSRNQNPPNSKISLALRRLRNRSSAQ